MEEEHMDRLKGKVAIITGAATGLGEADARLFAEEGAQVILTDVDAANGERIAKEIGPAATFMRHDVRSEAEWKELIAKVMEKYGHLDILVNNAAVVEFHTPETITKEHYNAVMSVDCEGTIWGIKHAIPAMKASGGGSIVNMSSIASVQGEPVPAYTAAKGAVEAYTRCVAAWCALNRIKIRCNSVHPSAIETPMVASVLPKMEAAGLLDFITKKADSGNPLGKPIDVAYMVLYLASDESRFVNGQKFVIDNAGSIIMGPVPGDEGSGYIEMHKPHQG
jgi:3(or 17)beta-hydroxysteroid dehydrogenase